MSKIIIQRNDKAGKHLCFLGAVTFITGALLNSIWVLYFLQPEDGYAEKIKSAVSLWSLWFFPMVALALWVRFLWIRRPNTGIPQTTAIFLGSCLLFSLLFHLFHDQACIPDIAYVIFIVSVSSSELVTLAQSNVIPLAYIFFSMILLIDMLYFVFLGILEWDSNKMKYKP